VGAGDCFVGVLAACLYKGYGIKQGMQYAVAAASLSVGKPGAQTSYAGWEEIETLVTGH